MKPVIPDAALLQHLIALGKTGSGKSSTLRLLVERLFELGHAPCIIDPKGDWWGLKSSADGRKAGYPVVIFGGEHADVPLNPHAGAHVAELIATGNRPAIIDLGGWMVGDRTRFFIDFAAALFRASRSPRWLVIDECHNFAPQGKVLDPDAGKMLHWANRLASEGRGKGLTLLNASQRPQKVHKDFLTSCETLVAMRVIHPLDRGAIKDWIDGCPDPAKGREVLTTLASMPRGVGWVWSPEIGFGPECISFPKFRTYDSFKAPDGHHQAKLAGWASVDLEDVKAKLESVVKEAEANDPKLLRQKLAAAQRDLETLKKAKPAGNSTSLLKISADYTRGRADGFDAGRLKGREEMKPYFNETVTALSRIAEASGGTIERIKKMNLGKIELKPHTPAPPPPAPAPAAARPAGPAAPAGDLPQGERKVLAAIAQNDAGVSREQLTVLTGYKKSSRDTYLQRLSARGLVEGIIGGLIRVTPEGLAMLGADFERLPTGNALLEHWLAKLPEGERRILEVVVKYHPSAVTRDQLSELTTYKKSSRDTYLQRLSARRLIVSDRGNVKAAEELFDG